MNNLMEERMPRERLRQKLPGIFSLLRTLMEKQTGLRNRSGEGDGGGEYVYMQLPLIIACDKVFLQILQIAGIETNN